MKWNRLKNWFSKQKLFVRALLLTLLMVLVTIAIIIPIEIFTAITGDLGARIVFLIISIIALFLTNYYYLKSDDDIDDFNKKLQ